MRTRTKIGMMMLFAVTMGASSCADAPPRESHDGTVDAIVDDSEVTSTATALTSTEDTESIEDEDDSGDGRADDLDTSVETGDVSADNSDGATNDDDDEDDTNATNDSVELAKEEFLDAWFDWWQRCQFEKSFVGAVKIVEPDYNAFPFWRHENQLAMLEAAFESDAIEVDVDALNECSALYETAHCKKDANLLAQVCANAFVGTLPVGSACQSAYSCASRACHFIGTDAPCGECIAPPDEGELAIDRHCYDGLSSVVWYEAEGGDPHWRCYAPRQNGQNCIGTGSGGAENPLPCERGYCSEETEKCEPFREIGDSCASAWECAEPDAVCPSDSNVCEVSSTTGQVCDLATGRRCAWRYGCTQAGICESLSAASSGQSCDAEASFYARKGSELCLNGLTTKMCDDVSHTCQQRPGIGDACDWQRPCNLEAAVCDSTTQGTCVAAPQEGQPCQANTGKCGIGLYCAVDYATVSAGDYDEGVCMPIAKPQSACDLQD